MLTGKSKSHIAVRQIAAIAALMSVGYLCLRTLRFTNDALNLCFRGIFLVIPFLAIRPVLQLNRWPKVLTSVVLVPVFAVSLLSLLVRVSCDIPALKEHRELSRELGSVQGLHSSVHLLWQETAGGSLGPHGLALEQRMFIVPAFYLVKQVDYFEGASAGILLPEGEDQVRLQIPKSNLHQPVDQVYPLKPRVYF